MFLKKNIFVPQKKANWLAKFVCTFLIKQKVLQNTTKLFLTFFCSLSSNVYISVAREHLDCFFQVNKTGLAKCHSKTKCHGKNKLSRQDKRAKSNCRTWRQIQTLKYCLVTLKHHFYYNKYSSHYYLDHKNTI